MHYLGLEPPKWDFTAKTVFGGTISGNTRDIIGKYLYYFGVWEPNLTRWIKRRLAPGDVFIDVGANIGYYTLLASKLVGDSGRVVSIEALPAIFAALENNIKANNLHNVRTANCAAWDVEDTLTIYTQAEDLPGLTTVMPEWAQKWHLGNASRVSAAPLSKILKPEEFSAARLIKIDVEGAEWHVIAGMAPMLASCRDDLELMIEISPTLLEAEGKSCQDLLTLLAGYGFNPYRIENDYTESRYLNRETPKPPSRTRQILSEQADIIFSRIDAEHL